MTMEEGLNEKCNGCEYYRRPADAPESTPKDCLGKGELQCLIFGYLMVTV